LLLQPGKTGERSGDVAARTECFDIFSLADGDSDVISQSND